MTSNGLHHDARNALLRFGLQGAKLASLNRTRNAVFRVHARAGRRYVLRIRSSERFNDVAARVQLEWLERLAKQTSVGAPIPLRTTDGRRFMRIRVGEERWRVTCFTWVEGRSPRGKSFLRPSLLRAVGRAVGQLHQNSESFRPAALRDCPQFNSKFFFGPDTSAGAAGRAYLSARDHDVVRRAADRIRRAMRRTRDSAAHIGIVHGDLEPANWVIASGMPRPIDFDEFGIGPFAFDLMQVLWTHGLWEGFPAFRNNLLTGYESVRPLSSEDHNELDLYLAIPSIIWLNRGSDAGKREEFRRWVGPTLRRIAELCSTR